MIHFDNDVKPKDARESIMLQLNREGRRYTIQEFIDLGTTDRDKNMISEALASFSELRILRIDENKKIRIEGTMR